MPRYHHVLEFESGELWEWRHDEGEIPSMTVDLHEGCLRVTIKGDVSGTWTTETYPWHRVRIYRIKRMRSEPRTRRS